MNNKINMKKIIFNIILSFLVTATVYTFSIIWNNKDKIIWIDDWLRHLQYANILDKYWYKETFDKFNQWNIIVNSILSDYKTDLWEWFHFLLWGIKALWFQDLNILKFYYSLTFGIIFFIFLSISSKLKLPLIIPSSIFILLIANDFVFRLYLARPFTISVILYALLILILNEKKYLYLIPIWIIWVFFHSIFYLLSLPILLFLIYFRPNIKEWIKIFSYSILWIGTWLLIHVWSVDYIILSFYHTILTPIAQFREWFASAEAGGINFGIIFSIVFLLPFSLSLALFFIWYAKIKEEIFSFDKKLNFLFINSLFLFLAMGFYWRFMDYFIVISFILCIYILDAIIKIWQIDISKFNYKRYSIGWILLLIFMCMWISSMYYGKQSINIKKQTQFLTQNQSKIKTGSTLITFKHLQFPIAFYALWENYKYSSSMEPMFFYFKDEKKFLEYKDIFFSYLLRPKNDINGDFYSALKKYNVDYLIHFGNINEDSYVVDELLKIKINTIKDDPRFTLIAQDWENYIWELK